MRPMLATRGSRVPAGPEWVHEVKWDGMRVLVELRAGRLALWSRNENDVTVSFPELAPLADVCGGQAFVLDGEVVAFAADGVPRFGALADRMHVRNPRKAEEAAARNPVTLLVFDLLSLDGLDVTALGWTQRREALEGLGLAGERWQVPPVYDDGQLLWEATRSQGLEGVVSKRRTSTYRLGQRSPDWVKLPHRPTASYVVGGWRRESGNRDRLGALLVGEATPDGLVYRGRVGSGVTGRSAVALRELLEPLTADRSPFATEVPREDVTGTLWVTPRVVVEVESLGFTPQGRLRQPSYQGVRGDLTAEDLLPAGSDGRDG